MTARESAGPARRLHFIDAARATAMLFVFVSHFAESYFRSSGEDTPGVMRQITLIASPTFLVISGVMIGFLWRTRRDSFDGLRVRFTDRGLFLLTAGHLLISGPYLLRAHSDSLGLAWHYLFTTDVIGVCMIIEPWLVSMLRPSRRLTVSGLAFALSWISVMIWHPHTLLAATFQETFFGSATPIAYVAAFPLLPWFGLDLAGTVLGEQLAELTLAGEDGAMLRLLLKVGGWSVAGAVGLKALFLGTRLFTSPGIFLYVITSPFQKNPPSLSYFLFYGGLGVGLILAGWLYVERKGWAVLRWAAALGQTSLVMFVTQSYVYYTGVYFLRPHLSERYWPLWLAASVVIVLIPSVVWHRMGLNKFITIGYRWAYERRRTALASVEAA